jgi:hypothetical protein
MIVTLNPAINSTTLFYDSDGNNVDWNVRYSLTNNSELLHKLVNFKLSYLLINELTRRELIEFHLTGFNLVKLLNATDTKFKYRYYLNWFSLVKLVLFK